MTTHVDASDVAWGVVSKELATTGYWTQEEKEYSINVRELMAILFALQLHAQRFQNTTIRIFTDNITALKYVTKSGGTSSILLQDLAVRIQNICNKFRLLIQYQHIPGVQNIQADYLSRQQIPNPLYEAMLPRHQFNKLQKMWGPLQIDAFASRANHQLSTFWSLRPDPQSVQIDAFSQTWLKKGMYLFPPWKFIPQVIQRIKQQKIEDAVLVTPNWPTQHWFPMLLRMQQLATPMILKAQKWQLIAWRLSGKRGRT